MELPDIEQASGKKDEMDTKTAPQLNYQYYPEKDIFEIEGVQYSGEFFRSFGWSMPVNVPFRIIKREGGTVTIEKLATLVVVNEGKVEDNA